METTSNIDNTNAPRPTPDHPAGMPRESSSTVLRHAREEPPPSPARFLKKPEMTDSGSGILHFSPSSSTANLLAPLGHSTGVDAISIPESTLAGGSDSHPIGIGLHFREGSGNARKGKAAIRANVFDGSEERLLSPHSYPPSQRATSGQVINHDPYDHAPISALTVFSRNAPPLSLPRLDKYISSLPLPAFSSLSRNKEGTRKDRFVPLDRLAKTGRSIESLETNFKRKPAWRNRNSILSGLVNIALGITVRIT
jgi:hypothetical protein